MKFYVEWNYGIVPFETVSSAVDFFERIQSAVDALDFGYSLIFKFSQTGSKLIYIGDDVFVEAEQLAFE